MSDLASYVSMALLVIGGMSLGIGITLFLLRTGKPEARNPRASRWDQFGE